MNNANPPTVQTQIVDYASHLIQKTSRVYLNLEQDLIFTTDDKIRLCLTKHVSRIEKSKAWITPLGILLTILIVFPTTTFRLFIVSADTWQAIFLIAGCLSFIWLLRSVWQGRLSTSVDEVVAEIKRTSIPNIQSQALDTSGVSTKANPLTTAPPEELVIHSARYGSGDKTIDVTQLLNSRVSSGRLEIHVSNAELGGDPIPGVVKKLEVIYSHKGQKSNVTVPEKETLSLP